jgi:hypothetical protein
MILAFDATDQNREVAPVPNATPLAVPNGQFLRGMDSVAAWMGQIKKVWAQGASSTLDLARVLCAAKNQLQQHYGTSTRPPAEPEIS